jgi:hypothetical protein
MEQAQRPPSKIAAILKNMSAILDQIKRNALPAAVLRTAAKGALPLPSREMIEILVYLTHNPIFAQDAKMTLAGWDLQSAIEAVSHADAPPEIIGYYWAEQNRRPAMMPALIENPGVTDNMLMELAGEAPREIVSILLASARVRSLPGVIEALTANPRVLTAELQALHGQPIKVPEHAIHNEDAGAVPQSAPAEGPVPAIEEFEVIAPFQSEAVDPELEATMRAWEKQYAAEIAAAENEPFELVRDQDEAEEDSVNSPGTAGSVPAQAEAGQDTSAVEENLPAPTAPSGHQSAIAAMALQNKAAAINAKKLTIMQRVGRMKASERVKTAFIGNKEERAILIRDRARIVQNAVLNSPKLTDSEVELFTAARNLDENVLREIARNRRFMKNYPVVRNLATNPKTPLDVALPLVKMLLVFDLKQLQRSKSVSETIRKMAQKYYQEKATSGGKTKS